MKIVVALHSCMDLGGIINHTEQLIGGLQDLGHKVHLKEMVFAPSAGAQRKGGKTEIGPSGIPFNQGKGWNFRINDRIAYGTFPALASARKILNEYDLVIWTVPVPPKNKQNLGNDKWPDLYDLNDYVKQVAFVHDGNVQQGAPHLLHVQERLAGVACVHGCALNGASHLTVPRALVLNPQERPVQSALNALHWANKRPGFVNMQTFKAWKHTHELIEAIAYMPDRHPEELREVAGKGIEYQYMTSEDKCKPHYFHASTPVGDDTDGSDPWFEGMKFWEAAEGNGMTHHDYWTTKEVDEWLRSARILVDPSWSAKYSKVGGHWNRVVVDAMMRGCVPVAQRRGMGDELFTAGQHYVDLGAARDAQDYADIILEAGNMNTMEAQHYRDYNQHVLALFDRKRVAEDVIKLAFSEHENTFTGEDSPKIRAKMEDLMFNQYGVLT